ncbi:peptidylprolyl isomerase [Salinibacter sp. 10B]|nr:peptidylprolyl isomerase [Salinibacter sp. 10B]
MGAMNKLRENTGVILWILVLSFGIIWTLQDSNVFEAMNQPSQNAAMVNDQTISNQEYNQAVDRQREQLSQRMEGELSARMEEMVRQRAYDQLINNALLEQEMKRLGITVTDTEIENMVFGENPHRLIRQQFADSTGRINYQLLRNMAQNPQANPQFLQLENYLKEQRRREKMSSLVQSSVYVSQKDVEEYYWQQNASASAQYVALRYASVPDDSISVSESDLRSYYEDNKEDYERKKTLTLNYVSLSKIPTAEDTAAVMSDLEELRSEFSNAENDSLFLEQNASERTFSGDFQTPDQLDAAVADLVYEDPTPGRVAGPVTSGSLAHLVKILDTQPADGEYVHASHILLESEAEDPALRQQLQSIRDSIESGAARFDAMAREYSDDQSASEGGDLGWFGEGRMVEAFSDAAFNASAGALVGPVKSEFGYHLIRVHQKASQAVQVADLAFSLTPSQATLSEKRTTLDDVAFYAGESSTFTEEAERRDLNVQEVTAEADQSAIPGIGQSRALTNFMETAETGAISEVIELDDKFVLAKVTEVKPEGYRPFSEVKAQLRPQVELQKKKEIQTRRMRQALNQNGFQQLPQVLGTQMRSQTDITFTTETVPGVGRDPSFAGTVFGLEEGETSGVVGGENAAFVVSVTSMQEPPALTAQQRQQIRQKLAKQRQREVSQQWISALKEDATIEDMRQQFQ